MKTKAKYVIVILFLCTIPLYFCRMIGWKDDAIRLYDVILYGMESQEGDSFVGGMIWKLMQESVFENINAWLIGTAAVTLVGSVLVTLLNGKKTYVLAIVLSIVTNGGLAWSMQRLSWGWKNKVDYNGQMTGMPLRMEFVWVWIALHVLILIFALWGMVSKEKSASKKSISRKIEPEKIKSKKNGIEKNQAGRNRIKEPGSFEDAVSVSLLRKNSERRRKVLYALRIKTAIRGAENEKGNQMSQVQTQDSERRCLLPVLWLPGGGRKKEEEKKENSKISGTCHCDCAVFRYPACHCSWITEKANTGMERKTTGRMETKTGKSAGR